jgi:hypothetical protein
MRIKIFELLRQLAIVKSENATKERLELFTEILAKYKFEKVEKAIKYFILEEKHFPDISEIIKKINNPVCEKDIHSLAVSLAGKLINCISTYGPDRVEDVEKELGEFGKDILEMENWRELCVVTYSQITTVQAQLREKIKSLLMRKNKSDSLLLTGNGNIKLVEDK